jgi:transposase
MGQEFDSRLKKQEASLDSKCLTNEQWIRVAPELPGKPGDPGCHAKDNRLFVEAVLWIARTGSPWRDLPAEFGKWFTATRVSGDGRERAYGSGFLRRCRTIRISNT